MTSLFRRWILFFTILLFALVEALAALQPIAPAAPLAPPPLASASSPLLSEGAANRAAELGFPAIAVELYRAVLAEAGEDVAYKNRLVLGLANALLMDNRADEAGEAMKNFIGQPTSEARLRRGLVALRQKRFDAAREELAGLVFEELPPNDRGWAHYLRAVLTEQAGDEREAAAAFQLAIDAATSAMQRARFTVALTEARLLLGSITDRDIGALRRAAESLQGRVTGASAVSNLAIALDATNRKQEAVDVLRSQIQSLPRDQKSVHDEWSLLLGLIAGPTEGAGRNALRNLLTNGVDRDKQRAALQLLAASSREPARRVEFRTKLDELIALPTPHPLLEELLLFRASAALSDRSEGQTSLTRAESDATQVLQQFPGSQLKAMAYGILTNAAWERGQYRNAANLASRSRETLPPGELRAQAGVLVAEAYFRGNDYVSAADAYAAALNELPSGVRPGDLMFQQILSEIRASRLEEAAGLLDRRSQDPRLDQNNRWQAEWNLTRALQASGRISIAYERLNRLLSDASISAAMPNDLRARMKWLQARLAFDLADNERTLKLTQELLESVAALDDALRADIASTTLLLQVQASFASNREDAAANANNDLLKRLRAEYPTTDAAVYSYIVEADAAARKGRLVDAQSLLTDMVQKSPQSPYAPFALYEAAQYAERRAQTSNYREANNLLESLVTNYSNSELVFYARLQQGHLLRKLTEFGRAQQVYAELDNNPRFANHPGRAAAQLALADTHAAQAADDSAHLDEAHRIYERLLDLPMISSDLRAEAGYKYGLSLLRRNQQENALRAWGIVVGFLTQENKTFPQFGYEGRYWLSRTLLAVGDLLLRQGKIDQSREAYELLLSSQLPGSSLAQEALERLRPAGLP